MTSSRDAYTVGQFMTDARAIYARLGTTEAGRRQFGALLQRLAGAWGQLSQDRLMLVHGGTGAGTLLASDGPEGLTLVLACFTAPTPIHDHGSWGVACVVQGHDRYQHWERLGDANDTTHAEVRLQAEEDLWPGDVVTWSDPPHDLHAQQGVDGPAWELVLFGRNVMQTSRHYFDPVSGVVRTALPH